MVKTVISLYGKHGIILQNEKIVDFIYVPEDYDTKDFINVLSQKIKNNYIDSDVSSKMLICYDWNGMGMALHDELVKIFDENSCCQLTLVDVKRATYKFNLLKSSLMDFALNSELSYEGKIEFKKMLREFDNLILKVNLSGCGFTLEAINKDINTARVRCFLQGAYVLDSKS